MDCKVQVVTWEDHQADLSSHAQLVSVGLIELSIQTFVKKSRDAEISITRKYDTKHSLPSNAVSFFEKKLVKLNIWFTMIYIRCGVWFYITLSDTWSPSLENIYHLLRLECPHFFLYTTEPLVIPEQTLINGQNLCDIYTTKIKYQQSIWKYYGNICIIPWPNTTPSVTVGYNVFLF